ncbi:hypothetical protein [Plantibacter sp. CFBP 8804]|uniref:hypothetical protein n=1 Tax=Plantibacter sp. CFBP 8804 TaxID=2775270 RepID=UPI001785EDA5|nr:hypothetical protein [Plantibacter sp. CFBP 8804]MBD8517074.1 hypothetical protein [Plantibacter sp. CFBP 8804]
MTITDHAHALLPKREQSTRATQRRFHELSAEAQNIPIGGAFDRYQELLKAGAPIDELWAAIQDRAQEARNGQLRLDLINDLRSEHRTSAALAASRSDVYTADELAGPLHFLNAELTRLVSTVRQLDKQLGSIISAEGATASGPSASSAWRQLLACVHAYEEIRDLQRSFTLKLYEDGEELRPAFELSGYLRDAFDRESQVLDWRATKARGGAELGTGGKMWLDWLRSAPKVPERRDVRTWPDDVDRGAYLRLIATEMHPWVPDLAQLQERHNLLSDIVRKPASRASLKQAHASRRAYFEGSGIKCITLSLPSFDTDQE